MSQNLYCATLRISGKDEYSYVEKALVLIPHVGERSKNDKYNCKANNLGLVLDDCYARMRISFSLYNVRDGPYSYRRVKPGKLNKGLIRLSMNVVDRGTTRERERPRNRIDSSERKCNSLFISRRFRRACRGAVA